MKVAENDLYFYIVTKKDFMLYSWCPHFQEKWRGYKLGDMFQECGRIREWLELQIKFTELGIINEALQNEIKNLKVKTNSSVLEVLNLQEEETKILCNKIVSIVNTG